MRLLVGIYIQKSRSQYKYIIETLQVWNYYVDINFVYGDQSGISLANF